MAASRQSSQSAQHKSKPTMPDLLSHLAKSAKAERKPLSGTVPQKPSVHKEDGIVFIDNNRPQSGEQKKKSQGVTFSTSEILSRTGEKDTDKVYEIELRSEKLACIPDIRQFKKVRCLDVSSNGIDSLAGLENNKDLRELKIYDNSLTYLHGLIELRELSVLLAQHNRINKIGNGLSSQKKLKQMRLDNNKIEKIELRDMTTCVALTSLDLSFNQLDSLNFISCLPNLEEVFASHNHITEVPDISRCKKLTEVNLSHNRISNVNGLKSNQTIFTLDLSHNCIISLKGTGCLKNLDYLNLSNNELTNMDAFPTAFPSLDVLDVSDNRLNSWQSCSHTLSQMPMLRELYMLGNTFPSVYVENEQRPAYTPAHVHHILPDLEVFDGISLRKPVSRPTTPLMRPMTASSAVSCRTVENQITSLKDMVCPYESKASSCYEELCECLSQLPIEPPLPMRLSSALSSDGDTVSSSRPVTSRPSTSRCSRKGHLAEALQFASTHFDGEGNEEASEDGNNL